MLTMSDPEPILISRMDREAQYVVPYATSRGVPPDQARERILAAYQRYAREVAEFIERVRPKVVSLKPKPKREMQDALFA